MGTHTSSDARFHASSGEDVRPDRAIGEPERLDWAGALAWVAMLAAGVVFWVGAILLLLYLVV